MKNSTKKLLGWIVALTLILACAPTAITPVPPLDMNSISTFIAQTAVSASTQTAAAIPTVGITSTLLPTLTLEPTFTPVPVIILSSPTSIPKTQYFRVRHDNELAIYNHKSRTAADSWPVGKWGLQTPEVFPLFIAPKQASGTNRTTLTGLWEAYTNALNDNDRKKLAYLKSNNSALFNGVGFPQMESLTMGGNIVTLDEIQGGWGRVHTLDYANPGGLQGITYVTNPDLVHKFVVVTWNKNIRATYWVNPPPPYSDLYFPLVSSRPVWISMAYLEAFPTLPMDVTANTTQDIRWKPDIHGELTNHQLANGDSTTIMKYYPSASRVWGQMPDGGWVILFQYQKEGPRYLTSWGMVTLPPIPGPE